MMKKILLYIIIDIVTILSACSDQDMVKQASNTELPDEISLTFNFTIPGQKEVYTRSIDPDGEPIAFIWLFLFNEGGYYLGHVRANKDNSDASDTFSTPAIPSTVRRIHFIANYNAADVNDSELLNRTEREVMTRFTSSSGRLAYWGRKIFTEIPSNDNIGTITLYRNQAAITYYTVKEDVKLSIEGFAICNAYAKGTVVPYNHEGEDESGHNPFDFNLESHDFVTLCSGDDLIKETDPTGIVVENEWGDLQHVFEHENAEDDPIYTIFKIGDKYYKLMIVDGNSNPYKIIRNHRYIFNFVGIPPTNLGYDSFEEAKNGVAANNVWVSIDDELSSIGDGETSLTIDGKTTRIYTEQGQEEITFTYTGEGTPVATWLSNEGLASNNLQVTSLGENRWKVTIDLNAISDTPQYGTLQIKAGKYPRTIQIIYLKKFEFAPVWTSSSVPRRSGEPVSIVFNIPDTYPKELYPVECKISCNLFDANAESENHEPLEVIEEKTVFTIGNVEITRDWDYKYVYKADKPGLHRVDFKTLVNEYPENPDDPSIHQEDLTWFLEAPYFNTIHRTVNMMDAKYENQEIIIYETTTDGNSGSGTYERELAPIKGQTFDLKFYLVGGKPAGTKIRIYMNETVEPGHSESDPWPANLEQAKYAPDAGRYFLYTVPEDAKLTDGKYLVSIPYRTVSAQCAGYARIAAANTDGNDADHCYKSAIVTRMNNPEAYNFNLQINDTKKLSLSYGMNRDVTLNITPNIGSGLSVASSEILIKTENLEPVDNNALTWDEERQGYIWRISDLGAQTYSVQMQTKDIVSAETITISEVSGNVAFYEDAVTITNPELTGSININDYAFQTTSPFIALEKSDGTRIGAFTVSAITGESSGTYKLTLRGEYDFTEKEELTVIYSPLESSNIYVGKTTITELLSSPTLTLNKQQ